MHSYEIILAIKTQFLNSVYGVYWRGYGSSRSMLLIMKKSSNNKCFFLKSIIVQPLFPRCIWWEGHNSSDSDKSDILQLLMNCSLFQKIIPIFFCTWLWKSCHDFDWLLNFGSTNCEVMPFFKKINIKINHISLSTRFLCIHNREYIDPLNILIGPFLSLIVPIHPLLIL